MRSFIFILFSMLSLHANAAVKVTVTTKVVAIESYSEYGQGDVIFKVANAEASCQSGYWLKKADPGFDANMSVLLSAFHAQSNVVIRGHDDRIWPGSSSLYCQLYSIKLVQ